MADGILTRESPHSFGETLARLKRAISDLDLIIFASIDHRDGARRAGLDMHEATVLTFGNPCGGTAAMLQEPLAALDLPLRVLVWEADGRTRVSFQDPAFVARRFRIPADIPMRAQAVVDAALSA
ncbi:MAG TPA: DUF302 domain-containing protein [Solirubrobacteraceae bacterium]|nr:DUF302 domain-containing protein [Solirubrobacteraceae bacterium]